MNDPEKQASQADFVLLTLADAVVAAEKAVVNQLDSVSRIIVQAERAISQGSSLNSLGELQGSGMAVDCKVGHLEQAVEAFTTAWSYLGKEFPYSGNPEATQETMLSWLEASVAKSHRLQRIVK